MLYIPEEDVGVGREIEGKGMRLHVKKIKGTLSGKPDEKQKKVQNGRLKCVRRVLEVIPSNELVVKDARRSAALVRRVSSGRFVVFSNVEGEGMSN